jgi:hypothetical protein
MNGKRIGIITFSNGYNYGAILQTYALEEFFKSLSYRPKIIDYLSEEFKARYKIELFSLNPKRFFVNLYLVSTEIKKRKKIDAFRKNHFDIEAFEDACRNQDMYDLFVTGSDQVWNPQITMMDQSFLLSWVNDTQKKGSYAASIGVDKLNEHDEQLLKKNLCSFNRHKILVREDGAQQIVKKAIGYGPAVVCDPTLLLSAEQWKSVARAFPMKEDYILVYLFNTTKEKREKIIDLARERGLSIKWMRNPLKKAKRIDYITGLGIEEWLGYFLNAKYIVTDSYHGLLFSLIFNKDFTVLPLGNDKSMDRFSTILGRAGLMDRVCIDDTVNENLSEFVKTSKQCILNMMDD